MKRFVLAATLMLALSTAQGAYALCGDVTGDEQRSASDALAVLRAAVGQSVELICTGDGPPDLRFYNPFSCPEGSSISEARFNGFTFEADFDEVSGYQTIEVAEISSIEIDVCETTYFFNGPVLLTPGRKLTFFMILLDPAIYEFPGVEVPAQFVIYDDGPVGEEMIAGDAPSFGTIIGRMYGGAIR